MRDVNAVLGGRVEKGRGFVICISNHYDSKGIFEDVPINALSADEPKPTHNCTHQFSMIFFFSHFSRQP